MTRCVLRGGSYSWSLRSTYRNWYRPEFRVRYNGFRLVVRRAQ